MSATESTLDRDTLIAVIAWLEEAADQPTPMPTSTILWLITRLQAALVILD
jgi:hypothetical protein